MSTDQVANNKDENKRESAVHFTHADFARLIISDLSKSKDGRNFLKKYKQSEVREIIEGYKLKRNQEALRDISQLLFAKSLQYQRLVKYFAGMATFAHVIEPAKDLTKFDKDKILNQYNYVGELLKIINLKHEMSKVLKIAFKEDVFYGYIHKDGNSFHIQSIDASICKITSIEDSVFNYSIDMSYFQRNRDILPSWPEEVQIKFIAWEKRKGDGTKKTLSSWVELDSKNTICIKINDEFDEVFPPFTGVFDSIFDIDGFKQLRKDKEEIGNYMLLAQKLPIRTDSDDNNDFLLDMDVFNHFHRLASETVPDNVGVISSPMELEPIKFEKDRADSDGVARAERDFWSSSGTSQLLFNADKSTSEGLKAGIKTDESMVFNVLEQIQRWLNRYLRSQVKGLLFKVSILPITIYNQKEMFERYLQAGQTGVPVKRHLGASVGLDPVDVSSATFLENDVLDLVEKFIPLQSSYTMSSDGSDGAPEKDADEKSDETLRTEDKPNG